MFIRILNANISNISNKVYFIQEQTFKKIISFADHELLQRKRYAVEIDFLDFKSFAMKKQSQYEQ